MQQNVKRSSYTVQLCTCPLVQTATPVNCDTAQSLKAAPSNEQCMAIPAGNLVTDARFQDQAPLRTWQGMHKGLSVGCLWGQASSHWPCTHLIMPSTHSALLILLYLPPAQTPQYLFTGLLKWWGPLYFMLLLILLSGPKEISSQPECMLRSHAFDAVSAGSQLQGNI